MKALKQTVVLFLMANMLAGAFMSPLMYMDFQLRRDFIYKTFCINKDKPITVCGGHCHFRKKLADFAEKNKKKEALSQQQEIQSVIVHRLAYESVSRMPLYHVQPTLKVCRLAPTLLTFDFFHPPRSIFS